jgi:hypothetical protein
LFHNNPSADNIINNLCSVFKNLNHNIYLLSFNYSLNLAESDILLNQQIYNLFKLNNIKVFLINITNVQDMLKFFDTLDLVICMRYHSVMFSIIKNKRFISLYVSHKIQSLLKDYNNKYNYELPTPEQSELPTDLNINKLSILIKTALKDTSPISNLNFKNFDNFKIFDNKKKLNILIKFDIDSFENVLLNCRRTITHYLDINDFDTLLFRKGKLPIGEHNPIDVARLLTYSITKYIQNPYIWGLSTNLIKNDFCLFEAIDYIWKDMKNPNNISNVIENYYPTVNCNRQIFINMDFIFQNNFANYHRSGWAYALGGLMNIDGPRFRRQPKLLLDTYVDRSFHWGVDTLTEIGLLPYKKAWAGIIHHTFDESHSTFNCVELFKNKIFLESLKTCKCLIILTSYLAVQIQKYLFINGFKTIPVKVIYHPMEFVSNLFTIDKFKKNNNKKIIQIGAWLRNPYSIYELPLYKNWKNPLNISKYALKGKDMEQYFAPPDLNNNLQNLLYVNDTINRDGISRDGISRDNISRDNISRDVISRDGISRDSISKDNFNKINKYMKGLYNSIIEKNNSVSMIEKLNNSDYDDLLSENIVFLDLVDCSAVNTVLEILVRNTPLLVNRHPAIEEILGKNYPGFYCNLVDAAFMLADIRKITDITNYIKKLDKTKYTLDYFVNSIQIALA